MSNALPSLDGDYLRGLGSLGLTARLKRLSDSLSTSIKRLYTSMDSDLEPSWHLLLLFLKETGATPKHIAEALRLSPPAVSAIVSRMVEKQYLEVVPDPLDGRSRIVTLTAHAREELPDLERIWRAGSSAIDELLEDASGLLEQLDSFEAGLSKKPFDERARVFLAMADVARPDDPGPHA